MRFMLALLLCGAGVCANSPEDAEVARARAGIEKLRILVDAGAVPKAQLEKAEEALADAHDAAYLRKTLYGPDLTEEQSSDMIAAAERRLERRKKEYTAAQSLVKEGVASPVSLGTFLEEIDRSRREHDLALTRARLCRELAEMARAEEAAAQTRVAASNAAVPLDRYDGRGVFTMTDFRRVESAFVLEFAKPLPVSALGETAVHRALGFDHRDRVDVAVHPDLPEGVWLRGYLVRNNIPFFAFRHAVPGKATGAHIHIGPMSTRLARAD